jgi:hypothetical protein
MAQDGASAFGVETELAELLRAAAGRGDPAGPLHGVSARRELEHQEAGSRAYGSSRGGDRRSDYRRKDRFELAQAITCPRDQDAINVAIQCPSRLNRA